MSNRATTFLTLDDLVAVHRSIHGREADLPIRDPGLLAAALARPQTTVAGVDA